MQARHPLFWKGEEKRAHPLTNQPFSLQRRVGGNNVEKDRTCPSWGPNVSEKKAGGLLLQESLLGGQTAGSFVKTKGGKKKNSALKEKRAGMGTVLQLTAHQPDWKRDNISEGGRGKGRGARRRQLWETFTEGKAIFIVDRERKSAH